MRKIILVSFIICLILSTALATATAPQLISVQGRLTDASDTPITANTAFDFYIYDDEFAGTQKWSEQQLITPDSDGIFTALLGAVTELDLPFNESYWLRVDVGGETLSPRYRITSVPYALNMPEGTKYCKRTPLSYWADFNNAAPDGEQICINHFGAGWSFADTDDELKKILITPAAAYYGLSVGSSLDGKTSSCGWIDYPTSPEYCGGAASHWTTTGPLSNGRILCPKDFIVSGDTSGWEILSVACNSGQELLWCCPP